MGRCDITYMSKLIARSEATKQSEKRLMAENRVCLICKREFLPSKYRKTQKVCSRPQCQQQRQLRNLSAWRQKNPGYFKISRHASSWAKLYRQRSQMWKMKQKSKVKRYKKAHKEEHREYMREYMYRLRHF